MRNWLREVAWVLAAGALGGAVTAQDALHAQVYAVPGRGSLRLKVPASWRVTSQGMQQPASVMLRVRPASGELFYVQVTSVWLDSAKLKNQTPESLKQSVERSADEPLKQAVEKGATIKEVRGEQTLGYYYSLTDRSPPDGEYKYLTQGSFLTGELLTVFTILYRQPAISEVPQVLKVFADAQYSK